VGGVWFGFLLLHRKSRSKSYTKRSLSFVLGRQEQLLVGGWAAWPKPNAETKRVKEDTAQPLMRPNRLQLNALLLIRFLTFLLGHTMWQVLLGWSRANTKRQNSCTADARRNLRRRHVEEEKEKKELEFQSLFESCPCFISGYTTRIISRSRAGSLRVHGARQLHTSTPKKMSHARNIPA
jgi:hypothetical protein